MKLEKENVRIILGQILDECELWACSGEDAVKMLSYINGVRDMANAVMDAIDALGGKNGKK